MGYIRMVRSGGLHYCSDAIRFVPDLSQVVSFAELAQSSNLSEETATSVRNLDEQLQNLLKNFSGGSEY